MPKRIFYGIIFGVFMLAACFFYRPVRVTNNMIPNEDTKNVLLFVKKYSNGNGFLDAILPKQAYLTRGDVIVFYDPTVADTKMSKRKKIVGRLVALPGNTLSIENKQISINGEPLNEWYPLYFQYRISVDSNFCKTSLDSIESNKEIYQWQELVKNKAYNFCATPETATKLSNLKGVINVRMLTLLSGENAMSYFPKNAYFTWNKDYAGPIPIPQKDVTAFINYRNIGMYKRIIEVYEHNTLFSDLNGITINGEKVEKYTFKQDYYFVISDNRDNGNDSRYFGFVPSDHIIGKAIYK
jgi:signal peptidase I